MSSPTSQALKDLRDVLREPSSLPDTDTFLYHLSSTLQALHLHPTSIPPEHIPKDVLKGIARYLSNVQIALITTALPTFWHTLDDHHRRTVQTFFVPHRSAERNILPIQRAVGLNTYLTMSSLFSTNQKASQIPMIPIPVREFALDVVEKLAKAYSIGEVYWAVWAGQSGDGDRSRVLQWEDAVKAMLGLPGKVANNIGRWKADGWEGDIPPGLQPRAYFDNLIVRFESLLYELSQTKPRPESGPSQLVLQRLASIGTISQVPSASTNPEPTFFQPILPPLLAHLHPPLYSPLPPYPEDFLPDLFLSLPTSTFTSFTTSLIQHLAFHLGDGKIDQPDQAIKRAAAVLRGIIGPPRHDGEAWDAVLRCLSGDKSGARSGLTISRIAVTWISAGDDTCIRTLTEQLLDIWTDHKNIKYGLHTTQLNLTFAIVLSLSLHAPFTPHLIALSHSSHFLSSMQSYLAHPDPKIRRLGMIVAEIISELTITDSGDEVVESEMADIEELKKGLEGNESGGVGPKKGLKRLKFGKGMWDGVGEGREECRWLRGFVGLRDKDAKLSDDASGKSWLLGWNTATTPSKPDTPTTSLDIRRPQARKPVHTRQKVKLPNVRGKPKIIMLDPDQSADPLQGYVSNSPSSSRSASPTKEYLEEVAADPTLALDTSQKAKIKRPVYIIQLTALLRDREKPESLEMGLKWGEGLVRAKRSFGSELEENAVELAAMAIALNDPFNLDDFDDLRQGLLNALVACSPRNTAPYLIEQYFNNQYSLQQKSVILTALAMGARELAGLSVPTPQTMNRKIDFPSKTLPASLHKKYVTANDMGGQLEAAIDGVRGLLLSKGVKQGEDMPEYQREKRLRVGLTKKSLITEIGSITETRMTETKPHDPVVPFRDIAAEYFIMPLINRFYQHFQDASARETKAITSGLKYRGAGTGLILSPMALEKLFMTLALLLHAARHSPVFLSVLAPECLELAVVVGSRHLSSPNDNPITNGDDGKVQEGQVVGSALEVALVALDGSVDLDGGRTLAVDKAGLVTGVGEWARSVFERESGGGEVTAGQGGMREGRIRAGAAGVVLKVAEIGDKWGRMGLLR